MMSSAFVLCRMSAESQPYAVVGVDFLRPGREISFTPQTFFADNVFHFAISKLQQ